MNILFSLLILFILSVASYAQGKYPLYTSSYGYGYYERAVGYVLSVSSVDVFDMCEKKYGDSTPDVSRCKAGVYDAEANPGTALKCFADQDKPKKK